MRTVSFKLPEQLVHALSDLARRRGSTRSALVRQALEGLAANNSSSVTAIVDNLVKPLDGPADLSANPRHMTMYGK